MALEVTTINITYKRGDSRPMVFVLSDKVTGLPLDITGYTAPVQAVNTEQEPTDTTNQQFLVTGVIDADPTTGRISFTPTTTDTDLTPNTYFYDAQVLDALGNKLTFVEGEFVITQDIAKD
ncbi:MAG: hypothetical protein ACTSUU_06835 [Candidatus Thorarchaeota archaeon]